MLLLSILPCVFWMAVVAADEAAADAVLVGDSAPAADAVSVADSAAAADAIPVADSLAVADSVQVSHFHPSAYGVDQPSVQVQQVPYYGRPSYNIGLYPNVRGGRTWGPFTDAFYKSSESSSSESDSRSRSRSYSRSSESSESDEHRHHHSHRGKHYNRYPSYHYNSGSAWPYQQVLSNSFYVPQKNHYRHRGNRRNNFHY